MLIWLLLTHFTSASSLKADGDHQPMATTTPQLTRRPHLLSLLTTIGGTRVTLGYPFALASGYSLRSEEDSFSGPPSPRSRFSLPARFEERCSSVLPVAW